MLGARIGYQFDVCKQTTRHQLYLCVDEEAGAPRVCQLLFVFECVLVNYFAIGSVKDYTQGGLSPIDECLRPIRYDVSDYFGKETRRPSQKDV